MWAFLHWHYKRHFSTLTAVLSTAAVDNLRASPWSGLFVFHRVVTPNVSWPSFSKRSLEGPLGSLHLLWCPFGCGRVERGRDEACFPRSDHYRYGSPTPLDWWPAALCSIFSKCFPSLSPEPGLILCSAKSSCSLQLLPQFQSDCSVFTLGLVR